MSADEDEAQIPEEDSVPVEGFDLRENLPSFDVMVKGHLKRCKRIVSPDFWVVLNELVTELKPVFGEAYQFYKSDPDLQGKWRYVPLSLLMLFHDLTKPRRANFVKRIVDSGSGRDATRDEISRLAKHAMVANGVYNIRYTLKMMEIVAKDKRHIYKYT